MALRANNKVSVPTAATTEAPVETPVEAAAPEAPTPEAKDLTVAATPGPETPSPSPDWEGNSKDGLPETKPAPAKAPTPAPAPAVRQQTAVAIKEGHAPSLKSLRKQDLAETYGNMFPRLVGVNGEIVAKKGETKTVIGKFADVQVLWHSFRWMVTPITEGMSDADKDAGNKFCRASYDGGVTIPDRDGGAPESVQSYIDRMADEGVYTDWKTSKYLDVFCIIFNSEKNLAEAEVMGPVQISVSATAVKDFEAFFASTSIQTMRGFMLPSHQNCMRVLGKGINGKRSYTILEPGFVPLEVLKTYTPIVPED